MDPIIQVALVGVACSAGCAAIGISGLRLRERRRRQDEAEYLATLQPLAEGLESLRAEIEELSRSIGFTAAPRALD
jgi:hypothetical protein